MTSTGRARGARRTLVGAVVVAALVVAITGCRSPSNDPEAYTDTNAAGTLVVEANFLSSCRAAGEEAGVANESDCQCIYDGLVENVPFEEFEEIQGELEDDPTAVPDEYVEIVDQCASGTVTAPSRETTTTAG